MLQYSNYKYIGLYIFAGPKRGQPTTGLSIFVCTIACTLVRFHYAQKTSTRPLYLGRQFFSDSEPSLK